MAATQLNADLEPHPFASVFPLMSDGELQSLVDDIAERGLGNPIWLFEGKILDGRNRALACKLARRQVQTREFRGTHEEALAFVWSENFERRHLDAGQRAMSLLKRDEVSESFTKAAKEKQKAGGGDKKSAAAKSVVQKVVQPKRDMSTTTSAKLGRAASTSRETIRQAAKVKAADPELAEKVARGEKKLHRAHAEVVQREKAETHQAAAKHATEKMADEDSNGVFLGDFRTIGEAVPDSSVALIFTDPPYDRESLDLYDALGEMAARVLVDGGSLVTYLGHYHLPSVLTRLAVHLRYFWIATIVHSGVNAQMREYGIKVGAKPLLWFVKGKFRRDRETWINDCVTGRQEKDQHPWQQSVIEARHFIEPLTTKGEIVVDPFCGGGTTALAAKHLGRKWWTCDVDALCVGKARERLS